MEDFPLIVFFILRDFETVKSDGKSSLNQESSKLRGICYFCGLPMLELKNICWLKTT